MPITAVDPQGDLDKFIDQWKKAHEQQYNDYNELLNMINQMVELAKKGEVGAAFQMAQMSVMPGAEKLQGDGMGQLAGTMNIAAAYQEFTTEAQKDMNGITGDGGDPAQQAKDFVKFLSQFYNAISMDPPPAWLDKNTQSNLLAAITKICKLFNVDNPNKLNNPDIVRATLQWWAANPDKMWENTGKTGQQLLQSLQAGFTQWTNTESAQSQGLQSEVQFASNILNQYMNTCKKVYDTAQEQARVMVQNQKTQ